MNRSDFDVFTVEMGKLSALYEKSLSEGLQALYFEAMERYSIQEVVHAMRQHIRSPERGQFFPKPADLIRLIDGDPESQALAAWDTVTAAWAEVGVYESVKFLDPAITAALLGMGGWIEFCGKFNKVKDEPFLRAEFCKRYAAAKTQTHRGDPLALPGVFEQTNRQKGYLEAIPEPVMIGIGKERLAIESGKAEAE